MINRSWIFVLLCFTLALSGFRSTPQPEVIILTSGTKTSIRGLSVVNDNVIWVSGSNGIVGKSTNAGKNWNWITVQGYEKTEFRDIEAFDANTAIIMGIAEPAYILKTTDGGNTWKMVYENKTKGMFLDAMDFSTPLHGLVVGDPIDNKLFLAETLDGGTTWKQKLFVAPHAATDSGEAFFAASGTNIRLFENNEFFIVSGGKRSRLITRDRAVLLPFQQGLETAGANSIDIFDDGIPDKPSKSMVVVGGDFGKDAKQSALCFISSNGGKSWKAASDPPHGYRSCVEFVSKTELVACGLNGVDFSASRGKSWILISDESFNVCRIARMGSAVFLAGENGKIGKLNFR